MSLMTGEPRSATVLAAVECELIVVKKESFQHIIAANQHVLDQISHVLSSRHGQLDAQLLESQRATAPPNEQRLVLLERIRKFFSL
jgi:CRP-like cAMP-binding protein